MAKNKLTEYDSTAANNTDVGGVNLAENSMLPSDVNNAFREVLSHLKDFADGTEAVNAVASITSSWMATLSQALTQMAMSSSRRMAPECRDS